MLISGVTKLTLLDYPGKTACIVFTAGCNFRCKFCHNPEFVLPERLKQIEKGFIPEPTFFNFLERRRGRIEGVVITGGEPTLMPDLESFIRRIRDLGYLVKLDSNGNRPEVLRDLLDKKLLDYVSMDVKTETDRYPELSGSLADPIKIRESIALLVDGDIPYEFRTTLIREVHTKDVLETMRRELAGAKRYSLQSFRPEITLDPTFENMHPFSAEEMEDLASFFGQSISDVAVRE